MTTIRFDMVQTVAVAGVVLFLGHGIRRRIGVLQRFGIPAPVVGGLLFAALALVLRQARVAAFQPDTTLQSPLMLAWFTTVGLGAGFGLLRVAGAQVLILGMLASLVAVVQNGIGIALAALFGVDSLVGLLSGSITMTGGHAIGAAFGTLMEDRLQLRGAVTIAMTLATLGLVAGGLLGGALATWLIRRRQLVPPASRAESAMALEGGGESGLEPAGAYGTLKTLTLVLVVIWAGGMLSTWLAGRGITLPGFVAAMLLAVVVRNAGGRMRAARVNRRAVENLGTIALSLFLVMAMMALGSWDVPALGIPLAVMFATQVLVTGLFAGLVSFRAMGADYDAAVMAAGHCGLGLGAAPAATAAMARVVARSGPANRAGLVVPAVGVYFNDVTNGIIITTYLNLVR
jgi:ESS family glutamate:Na+ symporter